MVKIKKYVLIVAGGIGKRLNAPIPKQFLIIKSKPLVMHTFEIFLQFDSDCKFILVLPQQEIDHWRQLCKEYNFNTPHKVVSGGVTRFHSVKNGLARINEEGIVFIHDGVRPLVSVQTIRNCYQGALEKGNALPVISPSESVREVSNGRSNPVDRTRYFLVQTPQTFLVSSIKKAYEQEYSELFTDDATVLESGGATINLVEGNRENIKITYPEDIVMAESLLSVIF